MADLVRRNQGDAMPAARMSPFELMREMMNWDPFSRMEPFLQGSSGLQSYMPAFEVKETGDAVIVKADVPGVKEQDLDVSLTGNRLTISGKREAERKEEGDQTYLYERSFGSFMRTFTLPDGCNADDITAELKEGVLTLHVPKKPEVQPKKISIKGLKDKLSGKGKA